MSVISLDLSASREAFNRGKQFGGKSIGEVYLEKLSACLVEIYGYAKTSDVGFVLKDDGFLS